MRRVIWTTALALSLGVSTPAWAQRSLSTFGSVDPNKIVNKPIDMSGAIRPPTTQGSGTSYSLTNFFSRLFVPGITSRTALSPLPAPSSFPSTQYKSPISPLPTTSPSR